MAVPKVFLLLMSAWLVSAQRPSFAGTKPIGFPEIEKAPNDPLGNRFGSGDSSLLQLPIEAKGDRDLVERISKMPIDKQPFWYLNWKAYEANRKNPQTYQPKPNVFNPDPNMAPSPNQGSSNSGLTSKFGSTSGPTTSQGTTNSQGTTISQGTTNSQAFNSNDNKYQSAYDDSDESNESSMYQNYRQSGRNHRHF